MRLHKLPPPGGLHQRESVFSSSGDSCRVLQQRGTEEQAVRQPRSAAPSHPEAESREE